MCSSRSCPTYSLAVWSPHEHWSPSIEAQALRTATRLVDNQAIRLWGRHAADHTWKRSGGIAGNRHIWHRPRRRYDRDGGFIPQGHDIVTPQHDDPALSHHTPPGHGYGTPSKGGGSGTSQLRPPQQHPQQAFSSFTSSSPCACSSTDPDLAVCLQMERDPQAQWQQQDAEKRALKAQHSRGTVAVITAGLDSQERKQQEINNSRTVIFAPPEATAAADHTPALAAPATTPAAPATPTSTRT